MKEASEEKLGWRRKQKEERVVKKIRYQNLRCGEEKKIFMKIGQKK